MNSSFDICVVGLGYIGLPTASIFATRGKSVVGVDASQKVVDTLNSGGIHIQEPDLDVMLQAAIHGGNLTVQKEPAPAGTFIIAVPTPFHRENGKREADLSYVESATRSIAPHVSDGALIIVESTSPVGTTESVRDWLHDELAKVGNGVSVDSLLFAHCPERVLPGQMLKELVSNDRISGGLTPEAAQAAAELYEVFCTAEIHLTDARTAELAKLVENASRDVSIAFANELSLICNRLKINVRELIRLANRHPRVNILNPGPGVGGHCIAIDPWFIVSSAPEESQLIQKAREVNDGMPAQCVNQVRERASRFKDPVIACLGLAFKANIDDLRRSPAMDIVETLADEALGKLLIVEPNVSDLPESLAGRADLVDVEEAIDRADIVLALVDHRAFFKIDHDRLQKKVVIDTRGIWSHKRL